MTNSDRAGLDRQLIAVELHQAKKLAETWKRIAVAVAAAAMDQDDQDLIINVDAGSLDAAARAVSVTHPLDMTEPPEPGQILFVRQPS